MTLAQYREALGLNPGQFAHAAGVNHFTIDACGMGKLAGWLRRARPN